MKEKNNKYFINPKEDKTEKKTQNNWDKLKTNTKMEILN